MRELVSKLKCILKIHGNLKLEYESVTHNLYLCESCCNLVVSKLSKKEQDHRLVEYVNRLKDIESGIFK